MNVVWHGFEIVLDNSIYLAAYLDKDEADREFAKAKDLYDVDGIETYVLGTVKAIDLDAALDAIRMGDWESSTQLI